MNNFEKFSQKRSVTRMIGQALNPLEWARQMSSSKYRSLIEAVDWIDRAMRTNIIRQKPTLRDYIHQARMALKNREYRKVFQYSSNIIDSVSSVFDEQINQVEELGRDVFREFSQDTMDEEERLQLEQQLGINKPKAAEYLPELSAEAGVGQWLKEKLPTKKEIEGALFDKLFRNLQGKQQEAARQALIIAERIYEWIDPAFDALDSNRRNIVEYVRLVREDQKKLSVEKERLKKMYINYFSVPDPVQSAAPVAQPNPINQPSADTKPVTEPILPAEKTEEVK